MENGTENIQVYGINDLPEAYVQQYGPVKLAIEQQNRMENANENHLLKSGDVNFSNVMQAAVRGMSKRAIAAQMSLHERTVEKIIYSPAGQALLRATLADTNVITCSVVPTLAREAYSTLEECMLGRGDRTRLAAAEATLNLIARLEKMAAVTVDYKVKKSVTAAE